MKSMLKRLQKIIFVKAFMGLSFILNLQAGGLAKTENASLQNAVSHQKDEKSTPVPLTNAQLSDSSELDFTVAEEVWSKLQNKGAALEKFPSTVIWLSGAPGAGKGTNSRCIIERRKLYKEPLIVSGLLTAGEMQEKINKGLLLDDKTVIEIVFEALMNPAYKQGVLVDGFPRTKIQAASIVWLYNQIKAVNPNLSFSVFVLTVGQEESVKRQLSRGNAAFAHNQQVKDAADSKEAVRATDLDPKKALQRYEQFVKNTYPALMSLKSFLPLFEIDTTCSIEEAKNLVLRALDNLCN